MWLWIAFGLMYFCVRQLFGGGRAQRAAVSALIAVAVGLSVFGFYQVSYSNPRLRAEYAQDPEAELKRAGMDAPAGSPQRPIRESTGQYRTDRLVCPDQFTGGIPDSRGAPAR